GLISYFTKERKHNESKSGLLFASGLITGEALLGILVAVPIFVTANKNWWPQWNGFNGLGILLFLGVAVLLYRTANKNHNMLKPQD
ncbi:MAG: oligopeptide transporter, OPT family, partial [bacterium]|nr:oligopeptide transporter, OPT family [bacterium]